VRAARWHNRPGIIAVALAFILCLAAPGCGYHVAGKGGGGGMPGGIETISIPFFVNMTAKPDIEGTLTSAFVSEFVTTVAVVRDGEAVMNGVIKSYSLTPVSYTQSDVAQEYRLSVTISLMIQKADDGVVIWHDDSITDYEDFVVDTTNVSATRDAETAALKKLAKDTARKIKERIVEDF
jgi:outer membrane lipopolysaccharide assembly protein LptE/RlpB